jgi:hypothetical protein
MHLGTYRKGEKVWIPATTHKFETGEEYSATVTGYYLLVGAGFGTAVTLTFNIFNTETGCYYAEIDTTGFTEGNYIALVEATVDTRIANQMHFFGVRSQYGIYGPD